MWLEVDIVKLGKQGRDFRGYEVGEFGYMGGSLGGSSHNEQPVWDVN